MFAMTWKGMSFLRLVRQGGWGAAEPIVDALAVSCFSCGGAASGGRLGFCRDCTTTRHEGAVVEELGGES